MFDKVLIANRGCIAARIIRTLNKLNVHSIAIYHEEDANSLHVQYATESVSLGSGNAADTYLNIDKIIDIAKRTGANAIHPGYGFLSENTDFVSRCEIEGIVFIGPTAEQIALFGLKHQARNAAETAGVPLVPGSQLLNKLEDASEFCSEIGFPVMLKSTAGGGGIGMQVCRSQRELEDAWETVKRLGLSYFSNDGVFIEKFIENARHIEVQVFGDGLGQAVSFGERDCSAQRRNQKVVEETPAPNISDEQRDKLCRTAEALMESVAYRNAGTVEFIFDDQSKQFYFLEVNTRLQVEHGVTEEVWSIDLVEWMVKLAATELGDIKSKRKVLNAQGHAIQVRVYAEDPFLNFRPSAGLLSKVKFPDAPNLRIDTWVEGGIEVPALFDPMIAKLISSGANRKEALAQLDQCLLDTELYGIETNQMYLREILQSSVFKNGEILTATLNTFKSQSCTVSVEQAGTLSILQDFPGRTGLWHVGVPPSGAMDTVALRLANHLLGNNENCAVLEMTLNGPTLRFNSQTQFALCGAAMEARLDDHKIEMYTSYIAEQGQCLRLGKITDAGARSYLAISGGFQCPDYLGSKSTFTLGQFGGHNGRALRVGDVLHIPQPTSINEKVVFENRTLDKCHRPKLTKHWNIRVIYGPHGAPDFFTKKDIDTFFAQEWEVHYNSSRTGIRLIGPKPEWARETGGEAGLHPSNIHDNAYAFGSIDFTGDMPVILGPDGPSLGGFVCPATVVQADMWKLGQLKAGAKIRFIPISINDAVNAEAIQNNSLKTGQFLDQAIEPTSERNTVYKTAAFQKDKLIFRPAGDHFLLVEFGPLELDIQRRFKVHALMLLLQKNKANGIRELTPGIRSLQIHYDSQSIQLDTLCEIVVDAAESLARQKEFSVSSRIVHLPLSWDDEACKLAIEKYMQSVRPDAPWCPSNLEFIRRINGLSDIESVKKTVFDASYLVMGLGDVYLGAPVATPIDPRHRLVTTKYNPARTWTAENSVGIGGAYMCVYGMEGPGGYQFVGRTLQMWNRYRRTDAFSQPWLLRFFDQIKFFEVGQDELKQIRKDFPLGRYKIQIEEKQFDLKEYQAFLEENQASIDIFQAQRSRAFEQELEQWRKNGQLTYEQNEEDPGLAQESAIPEGTNSVDSPVSGNVWRCLAEEGQEVKIGDTLMIIESMKMEIDIPAPISGRVIRVFKQQGQTTQTGQSLMWIEG